MPAPRVIKKYPNRRLYDTVQSRYVTLPEVRDLVISNIPFKVVDTQSDEDIKKKLQGLGYIAQHQRAHRFRPVIEEAALQLDDLCRHPQHRVVVEVIERTEPPTDGYEISLAPKNYRRFPIIDVGEACAVD